VRHYLVSLCLSGFIISSCATVNRGTVDYFRIDTVPQGAKVTTTIETAQSKAARAKNKSIPAVYKGCEATPCSIPLPRRSQFILTLEQDGYEDAQMYITYSTSTASFTANLAATPLTTGTAAVGTALVTGSILSGLSLGAVPSTILLSGAVPPALVATGGLLLADSVTGANVNLYPNPVVLQLAPKGVPIKVDPNVEPFLEILKLKEDRDYYCNNKPKGRKLRIQNQEKCVNLREAYREARETKRAVDIAARKALKKKN